MARRVEKPVLSLVPAPPDIAHAVPIDVLRRVLNTHIAVIRVWSLAGVLAVRMAVVLLLVHITQVPREPIITDTEPDRVLMRVRYTVDALLTTWTNTAHTHLVARLSDMWRVPFLTLIAIVPIHTAARPV
jgi:hypothetical protein